jgi:RNA polymerase sigma-32 factor
MVKIATTKAALRLFWNREVVNSDVDTLEALNITQAQLEDFEARYAGKESSIDDDTTILQLPSPYKGPEEALQERDEQRQVEALKAAVAALDERTRVILESRHLTNNPVPLRELGERFNISAARVEQIEKKALKELKFLLGGV